LFHWLRLAGLTQYQKIKGIISIANAGKKRETMHTIVVLLIGGVVGGLSGGSLFFVRAEPYKVGPFLATILRSILVNIKARRKPLSTSHF
jgi:hypothetical protein